MPWGTGNPMLLFQFISFIQCSVDNHNDGVHPLFKIVVLVLL